MRPLRAGPKGNASCLRILSAVPWIVRFVFLVFFMFSVQVLAHPTSFEGGFAAMSELSPDTQEISFVYSPKYWMGLGVITMRSPGKFKLLTSHIGWLAKRWNLPEAQGNLYFLGGLGYGEKNAKNRSPIGLKGALYRIGVQADFETRRIYTFMRYIRHHLFKDNHRLSDHFSLALGVAPYLGEFDEINSWLILKLVAKSQFQNVAIVPVLRFFYKNFLWEIGQNLSGGAHLNFMIRF